MKIKQKALAGIIGLTSLSSGIYSQTQKKFASELFSEIGVAALLKQEMTLYRGANLRLATTQNNFNVFGGATLNSDKKSSFITILSNEFKWNKQGDVSSWTRCMFALSKNVKQFVLELSPLRWNFSSGKFKFAINPALSLKTDLKNKNSQIGLNTIFQTIYPIDSQNKLFFEADYHSNSTKKFNDIKFSSPFESTSYRITFLRYF